MKMKTKLVPTLMPTRKARRAAAKHNMEMAGETRLFKRISRFGEPRASKFSRNWRNFVF